MRQIRLSGLFAAWSQCCAVGIRVTDGNLSILSIIYHVALIRDATVGLDTPDLTPHLVALRCCVTHSIPSPTIGVEGWNNGLKLTQKAAETKPVCRIRGDQMYFILPFTHTQTNKHDAMLWSLLTYGSVPEDGDFSWLGLRHISSWLSHLVLGVYCNLQPEWHPNPRGAEIRHAAFRGLRRTLVFFPEQFNYYNYP